VMRSKGEESFILYMKQKIWLAVFQR